MRAVNDMTGKAFGRLTVLSRNGSTAGGNAKWLCRCSCGGETTCTSENLRSGKAQSCGCLRAEQHRARFETHGKTGTATFRVWTAMLSRCSNPNNDSYPRYGARGIKVCERWASFENFLEDMGKRPEGLSIERENNDGNYEPGNCKWATATEQSNNRGSFNVRIEHEGKLLTVKEYAAATGMPVARVYRHKAKGKL